MSGKMTTNSKEPATIAANDREDLQGILLRLAGGSQSNDQALLLRLAGGSRSNEWNARLVAQTVETLTADDADASERREQLEAVLRGMAGIGARDVLGGMMAAKLIVAHDAETDCYRLAKNARNPDKRSDQLKLAIRLSRASATLLDALDRHRGKE